MFTRVVEITSKAGKSKELANTIHDKVVPILKKQRGFVDEMVLVSDNDATRILGMSLWDSKEDAQRYHETQYAQVHKLIKDLVSTDPVIRTFEVHSSGTHGIAAGKAA